MHNKRDWSVELMRIMACLIVIGCHTIPGPISVGVGGKEYLPSRVFLKCFWDDGVAVFWIITGFFLFYNFDYKQRLKKLFKHIFIPYTIYTIFIFYLYKVFVNHVPLFEIFHHSKDEYVQLFNNIFLLYTPKYAPHLWFLVTYMILIIVSPLFLGFAKKLTENAAAARNFCILLVALLFIDDFTSGMVLTHHGFRGVWSAVLLVLYGNILYQNRQKLMCKWWIVLAPLLFVINQYVRTLIQLDRYAINPNPRNDRIINWFSTIGLLEATLIVVFCFSLKQQIELKWKRAVMIVGSYTFPVYMIHFFVIQVLGSKGIITSLKTWIIGQGNDGSWSLNIIYSLCIITIVFAISFSLAIIARELKSVVSAIVCRKKLK